MICATLTPSKYCVVDLADGDADQFAGDGVAALEFAFVFQLDLAGDGGQRGVDIEHARDGERFAGAERAALGIRDDVSIAEMGRRCETPERLSTRLSSRARKASCSTTSRM